MEYKGKLYGKVGKHYFPLEATSNDFDNMQKQNTEMLKMLEKVLKENHCTPDLDKEINELISKITE